MMERMNRYPLLILFSAFLIACNQNTRPIPENQGNAKAPGADNANQAKTQTPAANQAQVTAVDPATAATIRGTIYLIGSAPPPVEIDMGMDPGCMLANPQKNFSQQFVVNHGDLANVYVYIKRGLEGKNFTVPTTPVVLDQKGCRYEPHVLALMAGQTLRVENSDPTMHNVHAQPDVAGNEQWNMSQMPKGTPIDKTFPQPEVMMPVKCNQHPWMKAYVNVAANPFYAVSDSKGNFEITGLPPGAYTVAAVHEALGEQTQKVSIAPKEAKKVDFTYVAKD